MEVCFRNLLASACVNKFEVTQMLCPKCGYAGDESERFCRKCGTVIASSIPTVKRTGNALSHPTPKDPDEMIGNGIGSVIVGDGFLIVAVILAATHTSISSLLWLLLLIPAFFLFGKGFSEVLKAHQIRRRIKQEALGQSRVGTLSSSSSDKPSLPSVTDETTRDLNQR
jgi:uncharacterized membrane protein YvbJ